MINDLGHYEIILKIIQINLNHCEAPQDLLAQTVIDETANFVLTSEPNKIPESSAWNHDRNNRRS